MTCPTVWHGSDAESILDFGAGIALPIAALGAFVGLRDWAAKMTKGHHHQSHDSGPVTEVVEES